MKSKIWEEQFSDNYKPGFVEKIVKSIEKYRQDVMIGMLPSSGKVILDLACGDGDFLRAVSNRFERLIGFDIARNRIENAIKKLKDIYGKKVVLKIVDLDHGIPLENGTIDTVVCEASLSYFSDIPFILAEVKRVLKKGGIFVFQVPNYAFLPRRVSLLLGNLPKTSNFPGYGDGGAKNYFTYDEIARLIKDAGLEIEDIGNSGVLHWVRKIRPQILAGDIIMKVRK